MQLSYLQISHSDICSKPRDQGKFLPQLGALGSGLSEAPLQVTHTHTTGFQVFDTPLFIFSHGQVNYRKQIVP